MSYGTRRCRKSIGSQLQTTQFTSWINGCKRAFQYSTSAKHWQPPIPCAKEPRKWRYHNNTWTNTTYTSITALILSCKLPEFNHDFKFWIYVSGIFILRFTSWLVNISSIQTWYPPWIVARFWLGHFHYLQQHYILVLSLQKKMATLLRWRDP